MYSRRKLHGLFTLCLIGLLALGAAASAGDWGKITDADRAAVAPPDAPDAGAIILYSHGTMTIGVDEIKIEYRVRIKVLTDAGVSDVGDRSIRYFASGDKIKDFAAETITPDGKKHKVKSDAVFDRSAGIYKYRTFAFPAVTPGSILECKYTVITDRFYYLRPWYFQADLYTVESQLQVSLANGFDYSVQYYNVPQEDRKADTSSRFDPATGGKIAIFTWRMSNLPAIKDEPYMSCLYDYWSAIRFHIASYQNANVSYNYLKSWAETGAEFQKELDNYCNRNDDVAKLARTIVGDLTDQRAQSRALYNWVVKKFPMTVSDQGKWLNNNHMSDLLDKKSGSIEERNLLLTKLHQALGIRAWPVMISTRDNARFDPSRPGLMQFNDMITTVQFDDGWEFLDTSSPFAPYGLLEPNLLTDGGFLIDGDKSDLVRMFIKDAGSARFDTTYMRVDSSGTVACSTRCVMSGYTASAYARRFATNSAEDFFSKYFTNRLEGKCTISNDTCTTDSLGHVCVDLDYDAPEMARELDSNVLVKPVCLSFRTNPFKSRHRNFPVDFIYPFSYHSVNVIVPPTGLGDITLPADTTFQISGAAFERKCQRSDSTVTVETSLTITRPTFEPSDYTRLRNFFDQVALADNSQVILSPSATPSPSVGSTGSDQAPPH